MLKAIIIDDEKDSIEALCSIIKLYNLDVDIIGYGESVKDAIKEISLKKPDLVFLDIQLGDDLSFSIFEIIKEINFQIIFISAHNKYVFKVFKYSAVDYLLKPIDPEELIRAIERAESNNTRTDQVMMKLQTLMTNINAPKPYKLSIPTSEGLEFIDINEIINIRADGSYSYLYLSDNNHYMVSKSIGEFQEQLPSDEFCRVHNSHLINLRFVKKLNRKGGLSAKMKKGEPIPIARNRKEIFMKKIENYAIVG